MIEDPRPIARQAPYTYFLPDPKEIATLERGDLVKLAFRGFPPGDKWEVERMWVEVTELGPKWCRGTLANSPDDLPQLRHGQKIKFSRHHIIDLVKAAPQVAELSLRREYWDRCLVDDCVLYQGVIVGHLYREEPKPLPTGEKFRDSGWRIRGDRRGLTDEEINSRKASFVALGAVLNRDDSWLSLIDAPIGSAFLRDFKTNKYSAKL